jgi:dienelactone hydrolase
MKKNISLYIVLLLFNPAICTGQKIDTAWESLKPYFNPPRQFENKYGNYTDPLKFYDGRKVASKEDWQKRRKEIMDRWHNMMGHWPPLILHPSFEILSSLNRDNFTQYTIRFYWRKDETTDAYLLIPGDSNTKRKPAVISVFYEPETGIGLKKPFADFAYQLAKRGFVTLSVGAPFVAPRKPYGQYYPNYDQASIQPLSMLAYLAANSWNLLRDRPDVDSTRIGIIGFSYGSKWAMFASCLYEKFACAVWVDGGIVFDDSRPNVNYWAPWYLGYYPPPWTNNIPGDNFSKGLYPELIQKGHDLTELHALMAPRPFFISGGSEDSPDRWIPLNQTIRVNEFLGYKQRVGMVNRHEHTPDAASNEKTWQFFEHFLNSKISEK